MHSGDRIPETLILFLTPARCSITCQGPFLWPGQSCQRQHNWCHCGCHLSFGVNFLLDFVCQKLFVQIGIFQTCSCKGIMKRYFESLSLALWSVQKIFIHITDIIILLSILPYPPQILIQVYHLSWAAVRNKKSYVLHRYLSSCSARSKKFQDIPHHER